MASSEEIPSHVKVGSRVASSDGDSLATVRYIGEVPPTEGAWLGVEWDDTGRGKHDGSHEGHRYFNTTGEKKGSFLRPRKTNFGVNFLTAVQMRYGKEENDKSGVTTSNSSLVYINDKYVEIEFKGMDKVLKKQSNFLNLREVSVRGYFVYGEVIEDVGQRLKNVTHLDLSKNLLYRWEDVASITSGLNRLHNLDVSANRICCPENADNLKGAFLGITHVYMNNMDYVWADVLACMPVFSDLIEISLFNNRITDMNTAEGLPQSLEQLSIDNNPLRDWNQVLALGNLPKLKSLNLQGCGLSEVFFNDVPPGEKSKFFPALDNLFLSQNKIKKWISVSELDKLPALEKLHLLNNPVLCHASLESNRQIVLARISHLKILDRMAVTAREQRHAELDYLKRYGKVWLAIGGNAQSTNESLPLEFVKEHPRFTLLVSAHGPPEEGEMTPPPTTLNDSLVLLEIRCPHDESRKQVQKKLPATMSVQKLRTLVHRMFKVHPEAIQMSYLSKQGTPEIPLNNGMKNLSFYSVENGDAILVRW